MNKRNFVAIGAMAILLLGALLVQGQINKTEVTEVKQSTPEPEKTTVTKAATCGGPAQCGQSACDYDCGGSCGVKTCGCSK